MDQIFFSFSLCVQHMVKKFAWTAKSLFSNVDCETMDSIVCEHCGHVQTKLVIVS